MARASRGAGVGHPARLRRSHDCAAPVERSDGYARRRPEETALYKLVAEHWPEFRERAEAAGSGLPKFVVDEFETARSTPSCATTRRLRW